METGTLEDLKVQPGDVVKWRDTSKERTIAGWKDGKCFATDQKFGGWESMRTDCNWTVVSRNKPASAVRTVTRKEIMPGSYGGVEVTHVDYATEAHGANVCIRIDNGFGPDSLRTAIATLTEIADALEAPTQ